jgi:hypothetical protein
MRDTRSDRFFSARGCGFAGVFALGSLAVLDFGATAFALRAFAVPAGFFAALAFFGADFAPVVLRVRIQILRSTHRLESGCATLDVFEFRP